MSEQDEFGDGNTDQEAIVNKNPYLLISAFSTGKDFLNLAQEILQDSVCNQTLQIILIVNSTYHGIIKSSYS